MSIEPRIEEVEISNILLEEDFKFTKLIEPTRMPAITDDGHIIYGKLFIYAAKSINWKTITCAIYPSNLSEDQYNLIRVSEELKCPISWQSRVKLELRFHELNQSICGASKRGRGNKGGWSVQDSAQSLNISFGKLSEDLNLARAMKIDPEIEKLKDRDTAKKVYDRAFKQVIASKVDPPNFPTFEVDKAHYGNNYGLMLRELYKDNSFHAAILNIETYDLDKAEWLADIFSQVYRTLRENSFFYVFCEFDNFNAYASLLGASQFKVQPFPIIFFREDIKLSTHPWEYYHNYQTVIVAVKGDPALLTYRTFSSVMLAKDNQVATKILLNQSTNPESVILCDFFAAEAASQNNRHFIVLEKDKDKYISGCIKLGIDPYKNMTYRFS